MDNIFEDFNTEQLLPLIEDLAICKKCVKNTLESLDEYKDEIYKLIAEIKEFGNISEESKYCIDKNVDNMFNQLNVNMNHMVEFKKLGLKKGTIYERVSRGISYKYKLDNGTVVENPQKFYIDNMTINAQDRTVIIGSETFKLSNSEDYFADIMYGGNTTDAQKLTIFVDKMQTEINKVLLLQSYVDLVVCNVDYVLNIVVTDITHFNLFDISKYVHHCT